MLFDSSLASARRPLSSSWPWLALVVFVAAGSTACSGTPERPDEGVEDASLIRQQQEDQRREKAEALFEQGNGLLEERDFKAAVSHYDEAISLDPTPWKYHLNKGIAESNVPDFQAALRSLEEALKRGGDKEPQVLFNLGNVYQNRGLYRQSIRAYRAGLALGPEGEERIDMLVNLGAAYIFAREKASAEATFEEILRLKPSEPRAMLGQGTLLYLEQKFDEAVQTYEAIHAVAPDYAQAYFNKAHALSRLKKYAEAATAVRRYLQLAPEGPYANQGQRMLEMYLDKADGGGTS